MSFPAVLAQLRYNAERLHKLPVPAQAQADRKILRELLTSTLDTLPQLAACWRAQPLPRPAPPAQSLPARAEQKLRVLEHQFLALSPGQDAPPLLWATLQQGLSAQLAEVLAAYW